MKHPFLKAFANRPQMNKTKILFLGSGYTTVWAYKYLLKNIPARYWANLELELISASDHHAFHGFTGEFLSGFFPMHLRHTPNELLFPQAKIILGRVQRIDQQAQTVSYMDMESGETRISTYHHLVVGMGTKDHTNCIEGAAAHCLGVKEQAGIQKVRAKIHALLSHAAVHEKVGEKFSFTVCGAGLAGVELCANLAEYLEKLSEYFPVLDERGYSINLVHAGERILPQLLPKFNGLVQYSEKILEQYGIEVHTGYRIIEFYKNGLLLENGNYIASDLCITTLGQEVCAPDALLPFDKDAKGRLLGNEYLQAKGYENIWIGGDVAAIPHISGKEHCRADALWAIKHGTWIGRNLARTILAKPLLKFTFYGLGQAASLGTNKAFTELYGLQIKGLLAWWIRFGFFLYFMPKRTFAWATFKAYFARHSWLLESPTEKPKRQRKFEYEPFILI